MEIKGSVVAENKYKGLARPDVEDWNAGKN